MATGTIASLRSNQGFGFIAPDGATGHADMFFHRSAVADGGFAALREGQRVDFDEGPDPRDPARRRAVRVAPAAAESTESDR